MFFRGPLVSSSPRLVVPQSRRPVVPSSCWRASQSFPVILSLSQSFPVNRAPLSQSRASQSFPANRAPLSQSRAPQPIARLSAAPRHYCERRTTNTPVRPFACSLVRPFAHGTALSCGCAVSLLDHVPVDNLPKVLHRLLTLVAVVEVVGVFPHVDTHQRHK